MKNTNHIRHEYVRDDPVLAEVVRRLILAYEPRRIYLFGSRARGDSNFDSDYDLMVIVPDDTIPARRRSKLAYEKLWGTGRKTLMETKKMKTSRAFWTLLRYPRISHTIDKQSINLIL